MNVITSLRKDLVNMSCQMSSMKTLIGASNFIYNTAITQQWSFEGHKFLMYSKEYLERYEGNIKRLITDLYKLNDQAYHNRYEWIDPDPVLFDIDMDIINDMQYNDYGLEKDTYTEAQYVKLVQYVLYQCAEADSMKNDLYRTLRNFLNQYLDHTFERNQEYKDAKWGLT